MQKTLREQEDRTDPYSSHAWWLFDPRETSPKTCPTCQSLGGSHYRGDELFSAFPYHIQMAANRMRAYVHPHCRCRLVWVGYTKDVLSNPWATLDKEREKITVPEDQKLSPSQQRMFNNVSRFSRETWKNRHKRCKC